MFLYINIFNPDGLIKTVSRIYYEPWPPTGHSSSPWDKGDWIHHIDIKDPNLRTVAFIILKLVHPNPLYIYVYRDHSDVTICRNAGFHICGFARRGWQIWTSELRDK